MSNATLALLFFALFFVDRVKCDEIEKKLSKIVETTYGRLQGFEYELEDDGKIADIFLGIPFAQPPVDKNRFEKPKILPKWDDVIQTTEWKPGCVQFSITKPDGIKTSEDCLYLNVFAPKEPSPDPEGYPVLVYIHGGAYNQGTAESIGFETVTNRFVSRGIIFVTIQYRVGPLGFASWGDDIFPGNYGLWDQWAALRFLKRNLKGFGGDAKRVTIWGPSSGAASVSAHTLSKHSRELFSQAIQSSGSQFGERGNSNRVIQATEQFGKKAGCVTDDSDKFKNCLKRKTVEEIVEAAQKAGMTRKNDVNFIKFEPRLDADFFTNDLPFLVPEGPKIPTMMGLALEEFLLYTSNPEMPHGIDTKEIADFSKERFTKVVKDMVTEKMFGEKFKQVRKLIVDFYINNKNAPAEKDGVFYFRKYTQFLSDINYNMPAISEAKLKVENGWKVFFYLNVYINRNVFLKDFPVKKCPHGFEQLYIFNRTIFVANEKLKLTENDAKMTRMWLDMISNFVKTGNPSTTDITWEPQTVAEKFRYLEVEPFNPEMKRALFPDRIQFWLLLHKHFEFDLVRGIHKTTLRSRDEL